MDSMAQFSASFLVETGKLLDEFGALLLAGENTKTLASGDIDKMFRILHTVKGSVGMMNLTALTHTLEGLFVLLKREGVDARVGSLFDLLFEALDAMRGALEDFAKDGEEHRAFEPLIQKLTAFQAASGESRTLKVTLTPECAMESVRAYLIVSTLRCLCPGLTHYPQGLDSDARAAQKIRADGLYIRFPASYEDTVRRSLTQDPYVADVSQAEAFPGEIVSKADDARQSAPADAGDARESAASYVSVRLSKLEALQNLTSELILAQDKLLSGMSAASGDAQRLTRACESLTSAVVALRMAPVSTLFQRLHRTAREAGRRLGREIDFRATGADVEIDKSILDALSESLTQIVRNAAVHGVESASERMAAGKPLMGKIAVSARNAGTSVVITVSDDGRGISARKVAAAAKAEGLAAAAPDSPDALLSLLMRPGVTTSAEADEMSGRGVGLDVVRTAVEKLRGSVTMETEEGVGTTFAVRIPQSLAVMDCLCLGVGASVFLLPALDVYRLLKPQPKDYVRQMDGRRFLNFEGHCLKVIDLGDVFGIRPPVGDEDSGVVAILEGEKNAVAVFFDALLGPRRAAIRPLPTLLEKLGARDHALSGCTILGENSIGLILDAEGLLCF